MADDMAGLLSPGVISRVGRDLPRREQQQAPPRKRPPQPGLPAATPAASAAADAEPRVVGSRLDVRA